METQEKSIAQRRQRDYTLGFIIYCGSVEKGNMTYKQAQKVYEIQGRSTVLVWMRKYGKLDWSKPNIHSMSSPKRKETPV